MSHGVLPTILARAQQHGGRLAIVDSKGTYTYDALLGNASRVAMTLLEGRPDLCDERVAFLITPGHSWVAVLWGIWIAGGIAVPLPLGAPGFSRASEIARRFPHLSAEGCAQQRGALE